MPDDSPDTEMLLGVALGRFVDRALNRAFAGKPDALRRTLTLVEDGMADFEVQASLFHPYSVRLSLIVRGEPPLLLARFTRDNPCTPPESRIQ